MTSLPEPVDPFTADPDDPSGALDALDDPEQVRTPLLPDQREGVLGDLEDLEVFEALLAPRGLRGLVVDCPDCAAPHYVAWELLRATLRHLLDVGTTRVHEPAWAPDPDLYVSWDYARGFADACLQD